MTYSYTVVLTPDDGQIAVRVPAMPGIFTWGTTSDRARKSAAEAIQLALEEYIERGQVPPVDRPPTSTFGPWAEVVQIQVEVRTRPGEATSAHHVA